MQKPADTTSGGRATPAKKSVPNVGSLREKRIKRGKKYCLRVAILARPAVRISSSKRTSWLRFSDIANSHSTRLTKIRDCLAQFSVSSSFFVSTRLAGLEHLFVQSKLADCEVFSSVYWLLFLFGLVLTGK